ncbi:hypothetical protein [Streptomyces sp. SA3_actG]|uniref:hypothetical protein n=1 Tax=Streptomyces sp. SA3_actG TaxID=683219 RepID=UPI0018F899D2
MDTKPEQSCRYPSERYALMLYGTFAASQVRARSMISSRVTVPGEAAPPSLPVCSGSLLPCGVRGPSDGSSGSA